MYTPIKYGGLQIDERPLFQKITWWVERVGWVVFSLFIVAALLGVFGSGILASASARGPGFTVDYERFARQNSPSQIVVRFDPTAVTGDQAQIWISQQFIQGVQIQQVTPVPAQATSSGEWVIYSLATQPGAWNTFAIDFVHQAQWKVPVRVGLSPGQTVEVTEFVYP